MSDGEVFRHLPFPFESDRFPVNLGAVVQRTVLEGAEPARTVIHAADGSWMFGDGINDPNVRGACVVAHVGHLVENDSTLAELARLEPGHIATRDLLSEAWVVERHSWHTD